MLRLDMELMVQHAIGLNSPADRETTVVAIACRHSVEVEPMGLIRSVV
jgi:hypothetical protein